MQIEAFRKALLDWYQASKRSMPWRETKDPYCIMVSELMLQQTQVKTVIPYYQRFIERWPTATDLADADEEALLKIWQGLGYYRRARYLKAASQQIVANFAGQFPTNHKDIASLKGVGAYTSAAIASISFEIPAAVVDGNVIRVLTRLFANDAEVSLSATKRWLDEKADLLLDKHQPGDFNQAMMELGAITCTPRNPSCLTCPVKDHCATLKAGDDPHRRPFKKKKAAASKITFKSLLLCVDGHFLLAKRPDEGLMAGMWELPAQAEGNFIEWPQILTGAIQSLGSLPSVLHKFTHLHATYAVDVYSAEDRPQFVEHPKSYTQLEWVRPEDLHSLPMTKVLTRLMPSIHPILEDPQCPASPLILPGMPTTTSAR